MRPTRSKYNARVYIHPIKRGLYGKKYIFRCTDCFGGNGYGPSIPTAYRAYLKNAGVK